MATIRYRHTQELLQAYLSMSFYSLCLFFFGHWLTLTNFWHQGLIPACMLGLGLFFFQARNFVDLESHDFEISLYILAQAMGHLWCAHIFRDLGGHFLFLTHGLVGMLLFYFHDVGQQDGRIPKGLIPLVAGLLLTIGLQGKYPVLGSNHLPSMLSFVLLSFGLVMWGADITNRYVRNAVRGYRKRFSKSTMMIDEEEKAKLFFHDLINQTHNILLFLDHSVQSKHAFGPDDVALMQKEVQVMQSLVQDHFGHTHRDGGDKLVWRPFLEISEQLHAMVANYLIDPRFHWSILFEGDLSPVIPEARRRDIHVHAPYLYRIFNNMVKNVSESGSGDIIFCFHSNGQEMKITARNKIIRLRDSNEDLAKKLEEAILLPVINKQSENIEVAGVGMESMAQLCELLGGSFTFSLEGDYWTTVVTLPVRTGSELGLPAAQNLKVAA